MQKKPLTTTRIAINNLSGKPWFTTAMVTVVGILAFALFGGLVLSGSLNSGINSLQTRLGADIAVVPQGQESKYEGIILSGTPEKFYFEKSIKNQIMEIENIDMCTAQFYLDSLDSPCCYKPVQIIGIDYDTDFVVKPWITQIYDLNKGEMIVGDAIFVDDGGMLTFYGVEMKVAAHLAKTGTGMDYSAYVGMNTMYELAEAARRMGAISEDLDIENSVSAVLIKIASDQYIEKVLANIQQSSPELGVVRTQSIISGLAGNLKIVSGIIRAAAVILGVLSVLIMAVLFYVFTLGRKKEFAVLRILGAMRGKLARIILAEGLIVSICGAFIGIAAGTLMVMPFSTYWSYKLGMPFLIPGIANLIELAAISLAMSAAAGSAAAAYSAHKVSRAETYATMREGE